jgi:hypothetical protein
VSAAKLQEVKDVCHAHYHQFITTVDELMDLQADVVDLRRKLEQDNQILQVTTSSLLHKVYMLHNNNNNNNTNTNNTNNNNNNNNNNN